MPCPTEVVRPVFGQQGPPGPQGPAGPIGPTGRISFNTVQDLIDANLNPSDDGHGVDILGFYSAGDGATIQGYLSQWEVRNGSQFTAFENVVTLTVEGHGFKSGDFVTVTDNGAPSPPHTSTGVIASIQVIDEDTIQYVRAATDVAIPTPCDVSVALVSAGGYRVVNGSHIMRAYHEGVINCRWFGARGSGSTTDKTLNQVAINQSLQAAWGEQCEAWLPKAFFEYYVDRQLIMREGTTFRIHGHIKLAPDKAGRVLLVQKNDVTSGAADGVGGIVTKGERFFIYGDNLGIIDGNSGSMQNPFTNTGAPNPATTQSTGINLIAAIGCENILFDSLTVRDGTGFSMGFQYCNNGVVRNPSVDSGLGNAIVAGVPQAFNGKNQDGIHFTDCTDCHVFGGEVHSADDSLAVTAIAAVCRNISFNGVITRHHMTGNRTNGGANTFVALGYGVRASVDSGPTYIDAHVDGVQVFNCIFEGGNGALVVVGNATIPNAINKNIEFIGNIIRDKNDPGIPGISAMQAKTMMVLQACTAVKITHNIFENCNRYISLFNLAGVPPVSNITIEDNDFINIGKISDTIADPADTKGVVYYVIDGSTSTSNMDNIRIRNNFFQHVWMGCIRGVGSGANQCRNWTIEGNECDQTNEWVLLASDGVKNSGGAGGAIVGAVGSKWVIHRNKLTTIYGAGIKMQGDMTTLTITHNELYDCGRASSMTDAQAIYAGVGAVGGPGSTGLICSHNRIDGCDQSGITLDTVDSMTVVDNRLRRCGRQSVGALVEINMIWRTNAGAYNFTNFLGNISHNDVVVNNANHIGIGAQMSGTAPTLASFTGVPLILQDNQIIGSNTPYLLTTQSSDAIPVPLPLAAVLKREVIGTLVNRAFNLAPSGTPADIPIPIAAKKYRVRGVVLRNPSGNISGSGAVAALYTATAAGGTQLVASLTLTALTAATSKCQDQTLTAACDTDIRTETVLYWHVTTADGGSAACDCDIIGEVYE